MRLPALSPDELSPVQADLYQQIAGGPRASGPFRLVESDGSLTGPFNVMLHAPAVGEALSELGAAIRYRTGLSDRAREVAILSIAVVLRSGFEWYAHERVAQKIGMSAAELEAIRQLEAGDLPPEEGLVLRFTRSVLDGGGVDPDTYAEAESAFGVEGLVELVALVGYYQLLAGMMRVFEIGVPDGEPEPQFADPTARP